MALVFTRDTDVFVNYVKHPHTSNYKMHVTQVSFSQTFRQDGSNKKTIDTPSNLIEDSSITRAGPAQFSLTIPLVDNDSVSHSGSNYPYQQILLELLLKNTDGILETFTLFVDPSTSETDTNLRRMYQLSNCVITSGSFTIARNGIMTLEVSGEASQLSRVNYVALNIGTGYKSFDNTDYAISKTVNVTVDNSVLKNVFGVALEIQNDIEWTKNNTLHNSLDITSYTQTIYPGSFTMSKRSVAGSISQYVGADLQSYTNIQTWKENIGVRVQAGLSSSNYIIDANLTPCSFTNRVQPTELYSQAYDYRMIGHPANLNTLFTY